MWCRNTPSESSHISFFCGSRRTHTGELTGLLEWLADLSPSLERPADISPLLEWQADLSPLLERQADLSPSLEQPVFLCLQSKITDLILSFQVPCRNMNVLFASRIYCLWLVIGTYIHFFFGNLLIFSANGNICNSINRL